MNSKRIERPGLRHQALLAVLLLLLVACGCQKAPKQPMENTPRAGAPQTGRGFYYTVRRGDTLVYIANLYHVHASDIMKANGIQDQYSIYVGQRLVIPGGGGPVVPRVGKAPDLSNIISESNFIWPLRGRVLRRFSSGGSETEHPRGIVIEASMGQPVVAAMSGVVAFVSDAVQGYGKTVMIAHAGNVRTYYAYNSRILVAQGDKVQQGQRIAEAGQSGRAASPQLFFKITVGADPVDPMGYLP